MNIVLAIIVLAAAGAVYYFFFMTAPDIDIAPAVRTEAYVPSLDIESLQQPVFRGLTNPSALPISVETVGNALPFSEIIFLQPEVTNTTTTEF